LRENKQRQMSTGTEKENLLNKGVLQAECFMWIACMCFTLLYIYIYIYIFT